MNFAASAIQAKKPAVRCDAKGCSVAERPGVPEDFDVTQTLRAADEAASVAHDFVHGKNGVTREQASEAIWTIHNALRPLFEMSDLGY